ncbi:hypothetical protein RHSIM_RhsimUnG0207000 [Rhododendron simsii]|uniref:Uncharacterized protein n=1 Tax=Rhododendron simsii TaxID=118357 RepID=A0A834FTI3_RHOSS|nr:hypothetical protein RHSIM_RhsimUnG0207000 [Rhododendron simsii]
MRIFPRNFAPLAIGILFIFFTTFASGATRLPPDEVEALKEIGEILGKTDWDFSVGADPCTFHRSPIGFEIRSIDLTRNYLSGTIPPEWGSMIKLVNISLLGNRLTGPIPKEFGNISTLGTLKLEFNQLSGPIPRELGSLSLLEKLHLTSNNFTGELPENTLKADHFEKLYNAVGLVATTSLERYQISSRTGIIEGSGLDGSIPPGIGLLTKLSHLRISDLNGFQAPFPSLNNLTSLRTLILRSCNIIGPLPQYLGTMTKLEILLVNIVDLSFNRLSGEIPSSFISLSSIQNMYGYENLI